MNFFTGKIRLSPFPAPLMAYNRLNPECSPGPSFTSNLKRWKLQDHEIKDENKPDRKRCHITEEGPAEGFGFRFTGC